ncbi:MAG: hypothetical protein A2381_13610 [Bdellovibrionales bacterium RIFOXYB1_FULL_37_110]|nr:MAG: hypothetical protein A2417_05245 [Bdellovibrionales bacterium RIFOXYC1_FULL_37_79]OFZ56898.1 MAG: hypothetical protein A2381_13610 [Bdellovibrionales bacterium RIFOXYB1_FULL_37_110]OFZ61985.1 MAG: hypothetical protein A2577_19080 [Bdellovibrionales bacterium RIFOXYD1_FULL_36_51]
MEIDEDKLIIIDQKDTTQISYSADPEEWETDYDLIDSESWPELLKYREQVARQRLNCIEEQLNLCEAYIYNGLYEKALNYLSILYKEIPDHPSIVHSIVEVLLLLGHHEHDFKWKTPPKVFHLGRDILETCYQYLKPKRNLIVSLIYTVTCG